MVTGKPEVPEGSAVGAQLIRDHPFRREALLSHQLAHELDGRAPGSPALNQDVEDLTFVIVAWSMPTESAWGNASPSENGGAPSVRYAAKRTKLACRERLAGGARGPPTNDQAKKSGAVTPPRRVCWQSPIGWKDSAVLALSRTRRAGFTGAAALAVGILDGRCARRSARRQGGTKGWSVLIEQRDGTRPLTRRRA